MTTHGWVNYSGTAEIVLVAVLAAAAAGIAYAGFRLPLPATLPRPGRAAKITLLAAWVLAIVVFLVSVSAYITQVYNAGLEHTPQSDPITPVTLLGACAVFVVIAVAHRTSGAGIAFGSAFVGAAAGPMIFELPFDLIIMPRSHPVIDPGQYRALLFGTLILVDITTLALLALSPAVRLRRSTLWCLAGMVAIFGIWALYGFSYPSAPVPIALNAVSKILALITALTLFLPRSAGQKRSDSITAEGSASQVTRGFRAEAVPAGRLADRLASVRVEVMQPAGLDAKGDPLA